MNSQESEPFVGADLDRLATILGRPKSDPDLAETLRKVAKAGARELLDYCTGTMVPTTIREVRANRINYLLQAEIDLRELEGLAAHLFQVPATTANRLIKDAASRFAHDWNKSVNSAVKDTLQLATWRDERLQINVASRLLHEWMREQIQTSGKPKMIETTMGGIVLLEEDTFDYLAGIVQARKPKKRA